MMTDVPVSGRNESELQWYTHEHCGHITLFKIKYEFKTIAVVLWLYKTNKKKKHWEIFYSFGTSWTVFDDI